MAKQSSKTLREINSSTTAWSASFILMTLWVGVIVSVAVRSMDLRLLIFTVPYLAILYFTWPIVKSRQKPETYKRFMILFNILGIGSIIWTAWIYYQFMYTFSW